MAISFMKKNRVLVIMLNPNGWRNPAVFGGGEIQTINTINGIGEIEWRLILPEHLRPVIEKLGNEHIKCFFVSPFFGKTAVFLDIIQGILFALKTIVIGIKERNRYDLVYASTTNFSDIFPSYILSMLLRKRLVSKYHISLYQSNLLRDIYHAYRREKNTVFDSIVRSVLAKVTLFFLQHAARIFVVSHYLKQQLVQCGFPDETIAVNYNGIDFQKLESFRDDNLSKRYSLCFMGRVEESKGVREFVNLVRNLKESQPNIQAVIMGDGSFLNETQKLIQDENLNENILVTGFLGQERYLYLQQSQVFVSPTYANEGFGLSIVESLYFKIPVVAYTQPVFEEIFSQYRMVRLVPQNQKNLELVVVDLLNTEHPFEAEDLSMFSLSACSERELDVLNKI